MLTILIVQGGVEKGLERWSKVLMPLLVLMILVVIVRSVSLPGALAGLEYYLKPDFSKITGQVVLKALGQAFFSLSVGWGIMITYGSYMPKTQSIAAGGFWVALSDTTIALLGGLMVFPAVFAFHMTPDQGTALTFKTLPAVFGQMPLGGLVGAVFFFLLTIAALTSTISMLEIPVAYFVDERKATRKTAAWIVGVLAFLLGIPSALSKGGNGWLSALRFGGQTGWLDILDYVFGTMLIILIAFLCSVYVGWFWKTSHAVKEIEQSSSSFTKPWFAGVSLADVWAFFIKFLCPVVILIVLLGQLGLQIF